MYQKPLDGMEVEWDESSHWNILNVGGAHQFLGHQGLIRNQGNGTTGKVLYSRDVTEVPPTVYVASGVYESSGGTRSTTLMKLQSISELLMLPGAGRVLVQKSLMMKGESSVHEHL